MKNTFIGADAATANTFKPFDRQLQEQEDFFKQVFGFKVNLSGVKIPQGTFGRLVIVPQELAEPWKLGDARPKVQPQNWIFSLCEQRFKCWRYATDLDTAINQHDRHPKNGMYAILVRDGIEADEENKNLPATHFWGDQFPSKLPTEGTIEHMLHKLKVWEESKQHLDVKYYSLLPGSRYSGGFVPDAHLYGREFRISYVRPGSHFAHGRARSAGLSSS